MMRMATSLIPLIWCQGGLVLNIEKGQWHSLKCLETGTVLLEAKDGAYQPLSSDEIMEVKSE